MEGARLRWGDPLPDDVVERLAFELRVIADMGFSSYFLIVWDLIKHARDNGIRVGPGRGIGGGAARWPTRCGSPISIPSSTTCCSNGSSTRRRISMPDIDMDFDTRGTATR